MTSDHSSQGLMIIIREISNGFLVECEGVIFCIQGEGNGEDMHRALAAAKALYERMGGKKK